MSLFKNRQFTRHFLWMVAVGSVGTGVAFALHRSAGVACLCTVLLLFVLDSVATWRRMQDIGRLSDYLRRIAAGNLSLELPDYQEGELSMLRSNLYKTAARLRYQAEQMEKEKRYLADALADISHQLKTPVTSMIVMSDLLKTPALEPAKQKEFLMNLDRQLEKTQWILVNLLNLSKLDAGQIQFHAERFSLFELAEEAARPFQILMELKNQTLVLNGDPNAVVTGDRNWTGEALSNLIKNCVEHTPEGGTIWVECRVNSLYTSLRVRDNGNGIAPEDLPHIFERFYKGKDSEPESVGIGLALAKTIFNRENARVDVRSVQGEGTEFDVRFYQQAI